MEKCKCYEEKLEREYAYHTLGGIEVPYASWDHLQGHCRGTKECDPCSCGGDPRKCDFYEDIRSEANKMTVAEMWLKAQEDGKTYTNNNMIYNKDIGFIWDDGSDAEELNETYTRSEIFSSVDWKLDETIMSKSEAEAKFNIKIVG